MERLHVIPDFVEVKRGAKWFLALFRRNYHNDGDDDDDYYYCKSSSIIFFFWKSRLDTISARVHTKHSNGRAARRECLAFSREQNSSRRQRRNESKQT